MEADALLAPECDLTGSLASIGRFAMQAYFVRGNDKRAQLYEVLDAFNIQVFIWLVASAQLVHCFGLAQ